MTKDDGVYTCTQCPKKFVTRSNLKRHMENPNIHNIPYTRRRDQKRWKDHSKKVTSRAETTERMRKWRAENRDKNKRNDLRCRVYRLARQKYGEQNSEEKQLFIEAEVKRRLNRRMLLEQSKTKKASKPKSTLDKDELDEVEYSNSSSSSTPETRNELPFYCAPHDKIELPSIDLQNQRSSLRNTEPSSHSKKSLSLSPSIKGSPWKDGPQRRLSDSSVIYSYSNLSGSTGSNNNVPTVSCSTNPSEGQGLDEDNKPSPQMQNDVTSSAPPSTPPNNNPAENS